MRYMVIMMNKIYFNDTLKTTRKGYRCHHTYLSGYGRHNRQDKVHKNHKGIVHREAWRKYKFLKYPRIPHLEWNFISISDITKSVDEDRFIIIDEVSQWPESIDGSEWADRMKLSWDLGSESGDEHKVGYYLTKMAENCGYLTDGNRSIKPSWRVIDDIIVDDY